MGGKVAKIASRLLGLFSVAAVTISFGVVVTARCQETSSSAVSGSNPINIWVDATRKPGVEAYMKAHPDAPVNLVLYAKQVPAARSFRKSFRCGMVLAMAGPMRSFSVTWGIWPGPPARRCITPQH